MSDADDDDEDDGDKPSLLSLVDNLANGLLSDDRAIWNVLAGSVVQSFA